MHPSSQLIQFHWLFLDCLFGSTASILMVCLNQFSLLGCPLQILTGKAWSNNLTLFIQTNILTINVRQLVDSADFNDTCISLCEIFQKASSAYVNSWPPNLFTEEVVRKWILLKAICIQGERDGMQWWREPNLE